MRDLDVVLYGATGFTGRQAAAYFGAHAPEGLRWAIAGRSADKLKSVAAGLPKPVETLVADASDGDALTTLTRRARVVLTTAGPFSKYGDLLVTRCVGEKTDYVDITGETPWVRTLIDRFHARAAADGTRIVPLCGYDSVPSDIGAFLVAEWIRREWGQPTVKVLAAFSAKGGINGGTIDSALTLAESGQQRALADVLLLNPDTHRTEDERRRSPDRRRVEWSAELDRWLAPFFMGPVNTRVVRRSNALLDTWGEGYARPALVPFTYDEALETRSRISALTITAGTGVFYRLLGSPAGRRVVRWVAPSPGQGPSEKTMDRGFFRTRLIGEAADGRKALGTFAGAGDPGNRATVKMLCEAALLLGSHPRETPAREELPGGSARGGVLTPATALGRPYVERLRAAGITLTVEPLA